MIKAGAQRRAAELGIALIAPDTSPRAPAYTEKPMLGLRSPRASISTRQAKPWSAHYRMETYLTQELPALLAQRCQSTSDGSDYPAIRWAVTAR